MTSETPQNVSKIEPSLLIASSWNNDEDGIALCREGGGSSARVNSISQAKKGESKKRTECAVNIARAILFTSPGSTPVLVLLYVVFKHWQYFWACFQKAMSGILWSLADLDHTLSPFFTLDTKRESGGEQRSVKINNKSILRKLRLRLLVSKMSLFGRFSSCNFLQILHKTVLNWWISWQSLWSKLKTDIQGKRKI